MKFRFWLPAALYQAAIGLVVTPHAMLAQIAGSLDPSFNPAASIDYVARSLAVQADGKILLGGLFTVVNGQPRNRIARLNADGTLESASTFNPDGALSLGNLHCFAVQPDGKILIGGYFIIARLNANGTLDTAFNSRGTAYDGFNFVDCLAVQADGKILIGGRFSSVDGQLRNSIARLNSDGTVESTENFNVGTGISGSNSRVHSLAFQDDGKALIGGHFSGVNGQPRNGIARLNADGSVESTETFNAGSGIAGIRPAIVYCLVVQANGKILIGGEFSSVNGQARNNIARLNSDGTVENTATFNPGTGANSDVYSIAVQADGKILIGGNFDTVNGQPRNRVARLSADGTLEGTATFDPGTGTNVLVNSAVVQADGKILLSGGFTSVNGQSRYRIARLANDAATQSLTIPNSARVQWTRGGAAPEVGQVTFELSTNGGANWSPLGRGTRIAGGWELTGLNLFAGGSVRARGRTTGAFQNGSSGLVESVTQFSFGPGPEIALEQPVGTFMTDGGSRDFGTLLPGTSASLTFTVRNIGNMNLTGLTITKDGAGAENFTVTANPNPSVSPNGTTSFTVQFAPVSNGTKSAALHIASNDADENPFDIILTGSGTSTPAEIALEQLAGMDLPDGGSADFGPVILGRPASLTFTIKNTGGADLTGLTITRDGLDTAMFTTTADPIAPIGPGGSTTFTVQFSPTDTGARTAVLHLASNDADENPFDIQLAGTGIGFGIPAPGDPDLNFGDSGAVAGNFTSVTLQGDSKIIAAGGSSIARFHENGTPDTAFGGNGSVTAPFALAGSDRMVALQPDGKVVAVGTMDDDLALVRYQANGSLDTSFGGDGSVTTNITTGFYNIGATRYEDLPSRETGVAVGVQPDGTIIAIGTTTHRSDDYRPISMCIVRYNPDGSVLGTRVVGLFSQNLYPSPPVGGGAATSLAVAPDGSFVTGAWSTNSGYGFYVTRYFAGGTVAQEYTGNLMQPYAYYRPDHDECYGVALRSNGGIVATGSAQVVDYSQQFPSTGQRTFALAGYGPGSFKTLGPVGEVGRSVAVQADGRIVVAGNMLRRYNADGSNDPGFSSEPGGNSVAMQSDGKILVAGGSLRRYGGSAPYAEISVEQPAGVNLTDGGASVSFGSTPQGSPVSRTFTIRNSSVSNLTLQGITIDGPSATEFTVTVAPVSIVPGGGSTTFTVSYNPAGVGAATAFLHIASRDQDESPFDITLTGTGLGPDIAVEDPAGTSLIDGGGVINFISADPVKTFTIRNPGTQPLTGLAVTKAGSHQGDFIVGSPITDTLAADGGTTFTVTFSPAAQGVRTATLEIASNDPDENPFRINLSGIQSTASEVWRQTYFGSTSNIGAGADLNDADGDGTVNLMEFATGSDPTQKSPPPGVLVKNGNTLELTYTRLTAALGELTYRLEWSESLAGTWSQSGGNNVTVRSDDGVRQVVTSSLPGGVSGKRFVRLRVWR